MSTMVEPPKVAQAPDLGAALRAHFGYERFRPGQEAIVRSVLEGRPTVAILPTGGGKSLCFQLPALLLPGTTVVASPLVALMKDQVDALVSRGVAATFVNSSLTESERQERQAQIRRGAFRLVYVAPERFRSSSFLQALAGTPVPLLAIDEAHCISAWGHDFRPDYQRLARARAELRAERILALTATATPEVRRDISRALELAEPRVFVAGFDRPNLFLEIARAANDREKFARLIALGREAGQGLVYAATRRNVEKVVSALRTHGVDAIGYHAGMEDADRSTAQDSFLRGEAKVIVATNAFGMGVDKPDVRFVAHFDVPRSIEAYYQEIGRAGRDGRPSLALLLFNFADVMLQRRLVEGGRVSEELVRSVWEAAQGLGAGEVAQLARATSSSEAELALALRLLEVAGHLERSRSRGPGGEFQVTSAGGALRIDFSALARRSAHERQMLDRMVRLVDASTCRRAGLLRYFGDVEVPHRCTACDNCVGGRAPGAADIEVHGSPRRRAAPGVSPRPDGPCDEQVLSALKTLRTDLAREAHLPPYVVFPDATLRELARVLPRTEADFLSVKGAGPARWSRYGERVLAITARPTKADLAATPPLVREAPPDPPWESGPSPDATRDEGAGQRALRATMQAYAEGGTLVDVASRVGRAVGDVARLLIEASARGEDVDALRLLGEERVLAIRSASQGAGGDLVAVRRRLPFHAALAEIQLALVDRPRRATG